MRIATWNVNSLRARLELVVNWLQEDGPDVVCLQETKVPDDLFPAEALSQLGYEVVFTGQRTYNGVAILSRLPLKDVMTALPEAPGEDEKRFIAATVQGIRVINVYVPNGQALDSPAFKQKLLFLEAMRERAAELADGPAIIAGDLNVCPTDLDVWDPSAVHGATHITDDERSRLRAVVDTGFVDAFRRLHPDEPGFTWWDYRAGHFHKGFGLRIDLALVSEGLAGRLTDSVVQRPYRKPTKVPGTKPSDHAPLVVDFAGS